MAPPPPGMTSPGGVQVELGHVDPMHGRPPVAVATVGSGTLSSVLRFISLVLTFLAAIIVGVARNLVFLVDEDRIVTVKTISVSAIKYFLAVNVIAVAYSLSSLMLSVLTRGPLRGLALVLTLADVAMVAFLFSANGAGSTILVIARNGEADRWPKICGSARKMCDSLTASIVLSMFAAVAYVLLVGFSVLANHKRC